MPKTKCSIYMVDANGKKVNVTVSDEVAVAEAETRRAEWRNDAKEEYYRDKKRHSLNDKDEESGSNLHNPEAMLIAAEDKIDRQSKMLAALKMLTPKQSQLVKMLKAGMNVTDIADKLKISKAAVSKMKKAIQEIFKSFL